MGNSVITNFGRALYEAKSAKPPQNFMTHVFPGRYQLVDKLPKRNGSRNTEGSHNDRFSVNRVRGEVSGTCTESHDVGGNW
jgi:hypothetical protein